MSLKVLQTTKELNDWRRGEQGEIGFVPTMGNLHLGHLSLMKKAASENEKLILSIFVNPTQFGPNEDFQSYPRTLKTDLDLIEEHFKDAVVFSPKSVEEVYPENFSTLVQVPPLEMALCGKNRPGHFVGVATVVYLLLKMVEPKRAYFGEKDFQQLLIIKQMAKDLLLPVEYFEANF